MLLSIPSKVLTRVILNQMKAAVDKALRDSRRDLGRIALASIKLLL